MTVDGRRAGPGVLSQIYFFAFAAVWASLFFLDCSLTVSFCFLSFCFDFGDLSPMADLR